MVVSLRDMSIGQSGTVRRVEGQGAIHKRLIDMGLIPGAVIEMGRVAPMGDPISIKIKNYRLSLRKKEAAGVSVEVL